MFDDIDFGKGVISKYIDFDININTPLCEQKDFLKEDIVQISYEQDYILDIGWYPEFNEKGSFRLVIIKDYDWEKPILQKKCNDITTLEGYMKEYIYTIQNILY